MGNTNTVVAAAEYFDDVIRAIPFGFLGAATFSDIHRTLLSSMYAHDVERIVRDLVEASRIVPYYVHGAATRWYRPIAVGMGATYTSGSDRQAGRHRHCNQLRLPRSDRAHGHGDTDRRQRHERIPGLHLLT